MRSIQNPFVVRLESRFWPLETGVMKAMVSSQVPVFGGSGYAQSWVILVLMEQSSGEICTLKLAVEP